MTGLRVATAAEQLRRPASGGIGTYIAGLLAGYRQLPESGRPEVELLASRPPRRASDTVAALGVPVRASALPGRIVVRGWDRGWLRAPGGFDVVHCPSLATMESGGTPLVTTVHDLLWRRVPEAYPRHGRRWHEAALHRALRRSTRLVVPSAPAAADLVGAGADPDLVSVIPLGCDHLGPPDGPATDAALDRIGVRGPFVLTVGTFEPRKNQARLIEAFSRARHEPGVPDTLVAVGPTGWGNRVEPGPGVVLAGPVTTGVLAGLYRKARLVAFVPLVEGFGLPAVEAMASGTPVVASPVPSTGGAAFEVDPYSVEDIADGLVRVATDEGLRAELIDRGRRRSGQLTWAECAAAHVAVFVSAMEGRAGGEPWEPGEPGERGGGRHG